MERSFQRQHCAFRIVLGLCCCSVLAITNQLKAELLGDISVGISALPTGEFRYEYVIDNYSGSTVSINAFVLDVGDGADLHSFEGPTNWTADYNPDEDPFELAWVSNSSQFDIPIGGSGTFVFLSPLDAEPLPYFVAHLAPDGSDLGSIFGDIDAPAVPAPGLQADFDGDGGVDGDDFLAWQGGFGTQAGAQKSDGDYDNDGDVDGDDFLGWQAEFGSGSASATVPEPVSIVLLLTFCSVASSRCRKRNGR